MAFRYTVGYKREHNVEEIIDWCQENIGHPRITWRLYSGKWRFRFKKDYTLFLLRWA